MPSARVEGVKRYLLSFATRELRGNIIPYWVCHAPDPLNGGFYGEIAHSNRPNPSAPKGLILNSRILWTFAAAHRHSPAPTTLGIAQRAFGYLMEKFLDREHEGFFWSVDPLGNPLDTKKQTYAQAFALYGLSEYHLATGDLAAKEMAINLFHLMERRCLDPAHGGYLEALSRSWAPIADMRLSEKDLNEAKTMNTHLHVLEAYANLYRVWPQEALAASLRSLLGVFAGRFVNPDDQHLNLFFDQAWRSKSDIISYGHDIEASWLLYEAAEVLHDPMLMEQFARIAVGMAHAAMEGLMPSGGMIHEWSRSGQGHRDEQLEWWTQAEAVVGLYNAYQLSGRSQYLEAAERVAQLIERCLINRQHGEWYYRVEPSGEPVTALPNAGFWKCPYHNARMCLEIIRRVQMGGETHSENHGER